MSKPRRILICAVALVVSLTLMGVAEASLIKSYQFNGMGNWSIDAVGSNSTPVGDISAVVPLGSTVVKAFLYSSMYTTNNAPTVNFDGTVISSWTDLGINLNLQAYRADVTAQVAGKVGGGSASPFTFSILSESPNGTVDGEALVVIYSNPGELVRTIAILDGFSASGGDSAFINFGGPVDTTIAGFEALMSLGIGWGYQTPTHTPQFSIVDGNGRLLTSSAGGQDDGGPFDGGLITIGGIGDSPLNPDPDAGVGPLGPRTDDELYNLALGNVDDATPFLLNGVSSYAINTLNPSNNDNIFFFGLNVTAEANIDDNVVPEPSSLVLLGAGLLGGGLVLRRRRRKAA